MSDRHDAIAWVAIWFVIAVALGFAIAGSAHAEPSKAQEERSMISPCPTRWKVPIGPLTRRHAELDDAALDALARVAADGARKAEVIARNRAIRFGHLHARLEDANAERARHERDWLQETARRRRVEAWRRTAA